MKDTENAELKEKALTDRELIVLKHWSELATEDAIADALSLSPHTIHTHLRRMRKKLNVRRTFDVYKHAMEKGWLG